MAVVDREQRIVTTIGVSAACDTALGGPPACLGTQSAPAHRRQGRLRPRVRERVARLVGNDERRPRRPAEHSGSGRQHGREVGRCARAAVPGPDDTARRSRAFDWPSVRNYGVLSVQAAHSLHLVLALHRRLARASPAEGVGAVRRRHDPRLRRGTPRGRRTPSVPDELASLPQTLSGVAKLGLRHSGRLNSMRPRLHVQSNSSVTAVRRDCGE